MNEDDPDNQIPKLTNSHRITLSVLIFLAMILLMTLPTTEISNVEIEWVMILFPIPAILLLSIAILRGKIIERVIALFFFALFVLVELFGVSELFGRHYGWSIL